MTRRSAESGPSHVRIREESDIAMARRRGRELGRDAGLSQAAIEAVATAISELSRNIVDHAVSGEIILTLLEENGRRGVEVIAHDDGPGIADVDRAMQDGYSSGHGLGLGLPSAKRLMDEFEVIAPVGEGTTVKVKKWATEGA